MARPDGRSVTPTGQRQLLMIDEVDTAGRIAHCRDKMKASIHAAWRESDAGTQIPQPGELWVAERNQTFEWHLIRRRETATEQTLKETLSPGDVHMRVPGALHIDTPTIYVHSDPSGSDPKPLGAAIKDTALGDGAITAFTLSRTPIVATLVVYNGSNYQHEGVQYTLSGKTVTFSAAPTNGVHLAFYYQDSGA